MGQQEPLGQTEEAQTATGAVDWQRLGRRLIGPPYLHLKRHHGWQIEVAFCDAKQRLGFHDPQVWSAPAVERATPLAWLVGTLVVLWYAESGKDGAQARRRQPWYRQGPSLTFADMLASCRLQLWRHWLGQRGGLEAGQEAKWSWLLEYVATAT